MLASGSMRDLFIEAVRQLFVKCARFNPDGSQSDNWVKDNGQQFVLITHSLGSYLALSTLNLDLTTQISRTQMTPTEYIYEHTSLMYFFANQIPLLELSDIGFPPDGSGDGSRVSSSKPSLTLKPLGAWNYLRTSYLSRNEPSARCQTSPQIIAWSDPSDLLTYKVPPLNGAIVVNLYVQNATHWLRTFEGPIAAHDRYVDNKYVLNVMLKRTDKACD